MEAADMEAVDMEPVDMEPADHEPGAAERSSCRWSPWRRRLWWVLALILLPALIASSCGLARKTRSAFAGNLRVEVLVLPRINQNSPVAVELLMIRDRSLWERLRETSAAEWFEERESFARTFPDRYQSWRWEWIPGQEVPPQTLEVERGVRWGLVFAKYFGTGNHRVVIRPREPFRLVLEKTELRVEPL